MSYNFPKVEGARRGATTSTGQLVTAIPFKGMIKNATKSFNKANKKVSNDI